MLSDQQKLSLLHAVAKASRDGSTQREIAAKLATTKVEARRQLRAAAAEGLVEESVEDSRSSPGRRLFRLSEGKGDVELDRLRRKARRLP